jgi:transposase-like protein
MDGEQTTLEQDGPIRSSHKSGHMTTRTQRIELITRGERRRRWSIEEKREIVAESLQPGVRPSEIIQRHGITSGQLYAWRQQLTRRVGGELARQITEVLWGRGERAITQKALSLGLRKTGNQAVRGGERDVLNLRRPVEHNMVVPRGQRGQLTVQYRLGSPITGNTGSPERSAAQSSALPWGSASTNRTASHHALGRPPNSGRRASGSTPARHNAASPAATMSVRRRFRGWQRDTINICAWDFPGRRYAEQIS